MDIKELKQRGNQLTFYIAEILKQQKEERLLDYPKARELRERVIDSLHLVGNNELARSISECGVGQRCESMWCKDCRQSIANSYYDTLAKHSKNYGTTNTDFLHVTALIGLCDLSVGGVNQLLQEEEARWRRIRGRKNGRDFYFDVIYELELINWRYLSTATYGSEKKKEQMAQLRYNQGKKSTDVSLLVHWHGITNAPRDSLDGLMKNEYFLGGDSKDERIHKTHSSGLYVQSLHEGKSLDENLKKIASYPFKDSFRYKHSYEGSDYRSGEPFTRDELGKLVEVYQEIQGPRRKRLRRHSYPK
jgi:hypothetical protein